MGDDFESQGKFHEAYDAYEHALAVAPADARRVAQHGHREIHLGSVETALGRPAAALRRFEEALAVARRILGPEHHVCGRALYKMAGAHQRLHQLDLAVTEYQQALAVLDKALGTSHPEIGEPLMGLGQTDRRHEPDRAVAPLERAVALYGAQGAPYVGEVALARFALAHAVWDGGDHRPALALATEARGGFVAAGDAAASVVEVDGWLAHHRGGSTP